jgi:hypothetical protein
MKSRDNTKSLASPSNFPSNTDSPENEHAERRDGTAFRFDRELCSVFIDKRSWGILSSTGDGFTKHGRCDSATFGLSGSLRFELDIADKLAQSITIDRNYNNNQRPAKLYGQQFQSRSCEDGAFKLCGNAEG